MKKFYFALICCLSMLSIPCGASATVPHFDVMPTVDSIQIDDSVYLIVDLKDNAGFGAMQFCITYDSEKLIPENVTTGELIPESAIISVNTDISGEINFSAISVENITGSGTVLISEFKAKKSGEAVFDFSILAYADRDGVSLDATSEDASINIVSDDSGTVSGTKPENDNKKPGGSSSTGSSGGSGKKDKPSQKNEYLPTAKKDISFADVSESHWAYSQINKVTELGLFSGTDEKSFSPELPMTRAMFVTVLYRYAGSPEAEKYDFSDVENSWYTDAVSWAAGNGIVTGTGNNKFSPDKYITRGEISTILCRFKNGKCSDIKSISGFNDAALIPEWGKEPVAWAIEQGLIMGRQGGMIAFSDNATRAETAVIFTRFLNVR